MVYTVNGKLDLIDHASSLEKESKRNNEKKANLFELTKFQLAFEFCFKNYGTFIRISAITCN